MAKLVTDGKPTFWQRIRCRWRAYHTWVDADGDGMTDTCAVCGIGVWATASPPR